MALTLTDRVPVGGRDGLALEAGRAGRPVNMPTLEKQKFT